MPKRTSSKFGQAPGCECCRKWIEHLQANGFEVMTHEGGTKEARTRLGVPNECGSCHTAEVGGYALPRGSPGMDGPASYNVRYAYDVLLIRRNGSAIVYQSYR